MSHTDYRTLIARGRKSGLNTRELYQAISGSRSSEGLRPIGQSDENGFVSSLNQAGQRVYRPTNESPRS